MSARSFAVARDRSRDAVPSHTPIMCEMTAWLLPSSKSSITILSRDGNIPIASCS